MKALNGEIHKEHLLFLPHNVRIVAALAGFIDDTHDDYSSSTFLTSDGKSIGVFTTGPMYYEHVNGEVRPLYEVCSFHGSTRFILKPFALDVMSPRSYMYLQSRIERLGGEILLETPYESQKTARLGKYAVLFSSPLTAVPVAGANDPCDGRTQYFASTAGFTWISIEEHAATYAAANEAGGEGYGAMLQTGRAHGVNDNWRGVQRVHTFFDTSSIPTGSSISLATWAIYSTGKNYDITGAEFNIYAASSTATSNSDVTTGHHDNCGTTAFSDTNIADESLATNNWNTWTLNATGIAAIGLDTGGRTRISSREASYDAGSGTPISPGNDKSSGYWPKFADNGSLKPTLYVEYSGGSAPTTTPRRRFIRH